MGSMGSRIVVAAAIAIVVVYTMPLHVVVVPFNVVVAAPGVHVVVAAPGVHARYFTLAFLSALVMLKW